MATAAGAADTADTASIEAAARRARSCHQIKNFLAPLPTSTTGVPAPFVLDLIELDGVAPETLTRSDLFLNEAALAGLYWQGSNRIGTIRPDRSCAFLGRVAYRLCQRVARRLAPRLDLPESLLVEAWFYTLWCELAHLVPARHLARRLARKLRAERSDEPVLIPLDRVRFHFFGFWFKRNDLEPFVIADALQKRGIRVAFTHGRFPAGTESVTLGFEPEPEFWRRDEVTEPAPPLPAASGTASSRAIVVGATIRGVAQILRGCTEPLQVKTPYDMESLPHPNACLLDPAHLPPGLRVTLDRLPPEEPSRQPARLFRASLQFEPLENYLATLLGPCTQMALIKAFALVYRHRLTEAHICDHPSYDAAIAAHAVRASGGKVILWPHSCNASYPRLRMPRTVTEIHAATRSAAAVWAARLPGIPVSVRSDLVLPREPLRAATATTATATATATDAPLNVVIIDNTTVMGRAPCLDLHQWASSYRRLFRRLAEAAPEIGYVCRTRVPATQLLLWQLSGRAPAAALEVPPPARIDLPNMVFLFPAQVSSALLEGIGRGIPAVILRDDGPLQEYLDAVPDCVPSGDLDFVMEELMRCRDAGHRQALLNRQRDWYDGETCFSGGAKRTDVRT